MKSYINERICLNLLYIVNKMCAMKKRFEYKTVVVKPKVSFWTVEYDPNEIDKTLTNMVMKVGNW